MNRVNVSDFRRADNRRNIQITLRGRRRADANRSSGVANVQRVFVGGRMNGNGFDAHLFARPRLSDRRSRPRLAIKILRNSRFFIKNFSHRGHRVHRED
jgi:hypothetical protein